MKMSDAEIESFLNQEGRDAVIATLRPDGRLHSVPVWYTMEDGDLIFSTYIGSVKAKNIQQYPRTAVTVSQPKSPIAFVSLEGEAVFEDIPDTEKVRLLTKIYVRYGESYDGNVDLANTALIRIKIRQKFGANYG
jgi:PPOX class probable F420-dependent enzyme